MTPERAARAYIRRLALPVYLPTLLLAAAQDAVTPFIVLGARDVGASISGAALIFALRGLAGIFCNLPAGWLVARLGERPTMLLSPVVMLISSVGCVVAPDPITFSIAMVGLGAGWSTWKVARLSLMTAVIPAEMRGRTLATLGGVTRVGHFVGPALAVGAVAVFDTDGAFMLFGVFCAMAILGHVWLWRLNITVDAPDRRQYGYWGLAQQNAGMLLRAGIAVVFLAALRHTRQVAIPLWGDEIGLAAEQIGLVFALSAAVEMVLSFPAGTIMDRWGRKGTAVRCALSMSATYFLLPLTRALWMVVIAALVSAVGNGLASGIVMVLGSDGAPRVGRAQFLAVWNLMFDVGSTAGPVIFALAGAILPLWAASWLLGAIGLGGGFFARMRLPETARSP